jgi:hypothetical protein
LLQEAYHGQRQEEKGQMLQGYLKKGKNVLRLSFEGQGKKKSKEEEKKKEKEGKKK